MHCITDQIDIKVEKLYICAHILSRLPWKATMRISDLRRKVHEKGLEVDGSREAMIAALEEALEQRICHIDTS